MSSIRPPDFSTPVPLCAQETEAVRDILAGAEPLPPYKPPSAPAASAQYHAERARLLGIAPPTEASQVEHWPAIESYVQNQITCQDCKHLPACVRGCGMPPTPFTLPEGRCPRCLLEAALEVNTPGAQAELGLVRRAAAHPPARRPAASRPDTDKPIDLPSGAAPSAAAPGERRLYLRTNASYAANWLQRELKPGELKASGLLRLLGNVALNVRPTETDGGETIIRVHGSFWGPVRDSGDGETSRVQSLGEVENLLTFRLLDIGQEWVELRVNWIDVSEGVGQFADALIGRLPAHWRESAPLDQAPAAPETEAASGAGSRRRRGRLPRLDSHPNFPRDYEKAKKEIAGSDEGLELTQAAVCDKLAHLGYASMLPRTLRDYLHDFGLTWP